MHCHFLKHEDLGMMDTFYVASSGSTPTQAPTSEPTTGDTCKAWCATKVEEGSKTWDQLCTWAKCQDCEDCTSSTDTDSTTPAPTPAPTAAESGVEACATGTDDTGKACPPDTTNGACPSGCELDSLLEDVWTEAGMEANGVTLKLAPASTLLNGHRRSFQATDE